MSTAAEIIRLPWVPEIGFHVRLREIRRQHDGTPTQAQFARLLGVKLSAYKQWESGRNLPGDLYDFVELVERVTGVPRTWLLAGVTEPDGGADLPGQTSPCNANVVDLGARRSRLVVTEAPVEQEAA